MPRSKSEHLDLTAFFRDLPNPLICAVSGGRDSVALVHALAQTQRSLIVAHFNHGWRAESEAEAVAVEHLARSLGCAFHLGQPPNLGPRTENAARSARYEFFQTVARATRCPDVVLAHHERDQAETFLLQCLRGGGSGAHGMRRRTERQGLILWRPWLSVGVHQITTYANQHQLRWHEDQTNQDPRWLRNKLRLELLPWLEQEIRPDAVHHLAQTANLRADEADWLETLVPAPAERLNVATMMSLPLGGQRWIIRRWLQQHAIADLSFRDIEAVRRLLTHRVPARVNLAEGKFARRTAGELWIQGRTLREDSAR